MWIFVWTFSSGFSSGSFHMDVRYGFSYGFFMVCIVNQLMFTSKKQKRPKISPKKSCNQLGGWKLDMLIYCLPASKKKHPKTNGRNRRLDPPPIGGLGWSFFPFPRRAFLRCKNVSVLGCEFRKQTFLLPFFGWWLNQPIWKILGKIGIFPK